MKQVLHLASWYPNKKNSQEGDFIQRQLQALSIYQPVYVIALFKDEHKQPGTIAVQHTSTGNLHETIAYYNSRITGIKKVDAFLSFVSYQKYFRKLIREHIVKFGKPDLIHVHIAFRAGILALWLKRKLKLPYIVSEHWTGYKIEDQQGIFFQPSPIKALIKKILDQAKMILPVSIDLADDIKRHSSNQNIIVVQNVVNETYFNPSQTSASEI
ncbi:MAG TPA: glycosyltransferase, partial [Flavitalea sp.]|nr:glycosyltransferase [Flavitalea sp.]